ncbi:unnamed protein product [Clavelina lepadiformis]|uniref:Uncharacterized protein n=1 Tax=Clavelina lepadiformis TaxID=159417 RepID=A0ABP0FHX6_CLALP
MSKVKREAVGQYNYLIATPPQITDERKQFKRSHPFVADVTVEIVDPNALQLFNLKPPKIFDTSYERDYRHPPVENLIPQKTLARDKNLTAYDQKPTNPITGKQKGTKQQTPACLSSKQSPSDRVVKSARKIEVSVSSASKKHPGNVARSQSAEPRQRPTKQDRINTEFYRALLKARSGSEWRRPPDVSYDVLNPEKPNQDRKTKPYGAQMEKDQENLAAILEERKPMKRPSTSAEVSSIAPAQKASALTQLPAKAIDKDLETAAEVEAASNSVSRMSTASGRSGRRSKTQDQLRPATTSSSISTIGDDYLLETGLHLSEPLETIQEEEILGQYATPGPKSPYARHTSTRKQRGPKLKKPHPPADLFKKRGPDPRFYASKKNLRTPNEMERFRKARGRTFMRNVEQAIPELDCKDHEVKYQPERQLLQDARWKIRKDVKDVRDKNLHSLVDRFEKRHNIVKEETRTRLGDPTYIGRNPVSVYKLQEVTNQARERQPDLGFQIKYPLHNRRRVTPSLGSVQRARNLGSHAQIFNQACAPPHWGPQKVDHSIFLPQMAQGI